MHLRLETQKPRPIWLCSLSPRSRLSLKNGQLSPQQRQRGPGKQGAGVVVFPGPTPENKEKLSNIDKNDFRVIFPYFRGWSQEGECGIFPLLSGILHVGRFPRRVKGTGPNTN